MDSIVDDKKKVTKLLLCGYNCFLCAHRNRNISVILTRTKHIAPDDLWCDFSLREPEKKVCVNFKRKPEIEAEWPMKAPVDSVILEKQYTMISLYNKYFRKGVIM